MGWAKPGQWNLMPKDRISSSTCFPLTAPDEQQSYGVAKSYSVN